MYQKYPNEVKKLNKYRKAKREYLRELRNLEELETLIYNISNPLSKAKVKTSPNPDKLSAYIDEHERIKKRCEEKQLKALAEMREILKKIDGLETDIFKDILTKKYIHGLKWEQIAIDLNYEYSYLSRLHNKAIEELKANDRRQKKIL